MHTKNMGKHIQLWTREPNNEMQIFCHKHNFYLSCDIMFLFSITFPVYIFQFLYRPQMKRSVHPLVKNMFR